MERTYSTPLLDKLGVRTGSRVLLIGDAAMTVAPLLAERTSSVESVVDTPATALRPYDLVLFTADDAAELRHLANLRSAIFPDGAVWVVSRKGRAATLREIEVIAAARAADLVDNKVAAFSETHTALRLVVPRASRPTRP